MLYVETLSVYPLLYLNQIQTSVGLLPTELARRVMKSADLEERARRAGAYVLLDRMVRKHTNEFKSNVAGIVKSEYSSFFGGRNALDTVRYDSYGKPYFDEKDNATFNLSHSQYMVACALVIEPDGEIAAQCGVDIELVNYDLVRAERVAERYFSDGEKLLLAPVAADPEEYCRLFTRIWTRKEAILKYLGVGLTQISQADSTRPGDHGCFFVESEEVHTYTDFVDGKEKEELYYITACAKIGEKLPDPPAKTAETTAEDKFVMGNPRNMQL